MNIKGLPQLPARSKLLLDKKPSRKGKTSRYLLQLGLRLEYENGYLLEVRNLKGKLAKVAIVETGRPGFTVRYYNRPYTTIGWGYRKAEPLAIRLALRGHKSVVIL